MADAELENFKTNIDLRAYAAGQNFEIDRKQSWRGSTVMRNPLTNDKIIIKRDADGHYVYFSVRDLADNGTIIDFAKRRLGLSLGGVRKELRSFMGAPTPVLAPFPPLVKVAKDRIRVEQAYARMEVAVTHPYLENERAIPRELLQSRRFAGRIRIDARGNAIFPHFDNDGLSGFEIKNVGFTGFASHGAKGTWTSHVQDDDQRLIFAEATIDALSYAALFPDPHARYASIGGKPTVAQKELIRAAAAVMPAASTVVAAMDADASGREYAEIVREAVKLTGRSDLRFEIHEPEGAKDWNELLQRRHRLPLPYRHEEPSVA
jgi:hypothetical protein